VVRSQKLFFTFISGFQIDVILSYTVNNSSSFFSSPSVWLMRSASSLLEDDLLLVLVSITLFFKSSEMWEPQEKYYANIFELYLFRGWPEIRADQRFFSSSVWEIIYSIVSHLFLLSIHLKKKNFLRPIEFLLR